MRHRFETWRCRGSRPSTATTTARPAAPAAQSGARRAPAKKSKKKIDPRSFPDAPGEGRAIAYCDGACSGNPGPAGLGVVLRHGQCEERLSEFLGAGTNNIAELTAILRTLEQAPVLPLTIYTDSSYAIGLLTKGWKAKANKELVAQLRATMSQRDDVELLYVPGHAGVLGNELADELAVKAVEDRATAGWLRRELTS